MRRPLAKEALYSSSHHRPRDERGHCDVPEWDEEGFAERIKRIDPDGNRALALLRKFGKPDRMDGQ